MTTLKETMQLKKVLSLSLFITLYNSAHPMELITAIIREHALPVATVLGIGAASGTIQGLIFNQMHKKYNISERYSIVKCAAYGTASSAALLLTCKYGPWPKLTNNEIYCTEIFYAASKTIAHSFLYHIARKPEETRFRFENQKLNLDLSLLKYRYSKERITEFSQCNSAQHEDNLINSLMGTDIAAQIPAVIAAYIGTACVHHFFIKN